MAEWWKETVWLKPSWWQSGPEGEPRDLVYTNHARQRAKNGGMPIFKTMPSNIKYLSATVRPTHVHSAMFLTRVGGRDIRLVVAVPLLQEYGVVVTMYEEEERGEIARATAGHGMRMRRRGRRGMNVQGFAEA